MNPSDSGRLHQESIVIDGLNASHLRATPVLDRLHAGGITAVHATVAAWHGLAQTMTAVAEHFDLFARQPGRIIPVREAPDILTAKVTDRVGIILGFQSADPIEDNIRLLAVYHALGVRVIQLTYNAANRLGSGYTVPEDEGLTPFGRDALLEMNRLGILVDVSHCGDRTTRVAIEASESPVAVRHANSRRFCGEARNKAPEALRALAAKGGVVGATAFPLALTGKRSATIEDYLAAIDDLVDLVGVDHVGLGTDFMEEMPRQVAREALSALSAEDAERFFDVQTTRGLESVSEAGNVTRGLLERGYAHEDVRKVIGGNWLRLYRQVWKPAFAPREGVAIQVLPGFGRRRSDRNPKPAAL